MDARRRDVQRVAQLGAEQIFGGANGAPREPRTEQTERQRRAKEHDEDDARANRIDSPNHRLFHVMLAEQPVEPRARDAEDLGGARLVAARAVSTRVTCSPSISSSVAELRRRARGDAIDRCSAWITLPDGEHHAAHETILELAHVARPRVLHRARERVARQHCRRQPERRAGASTQMCRASSGMSAARSRSGGSAISTTRRR